MFGATSKNINQYKAMSVETGVAAANPVQLIVMLYDGAIVACYSAMAYTQKNDYPNKSEMIFKAIRIIQSGLRMSLNKEHGGKIAENLDALYIYMTNRLVKANIDNKIEPIKEVINLLNELRDAWNEISSRPEALIHNATNRLADANAVAYLEKV